MKEKQIFDNSRTKILLGEENAKKLASKKVTVVGVGGVGGYVATLLVRAGIESIKIVDFDTVSPSNINRQVVANIDTIGKSKVQVLKEMLLKINANLDCQAVDAKLDKSNVSNIITDCDMCIDCIDSVNDKAALISYCKSNNIDIISAMGAGNRISVPKYYLTDIYKTHDDGLAKALRKKLRTMGVTNLDVVTCEDKPLSVNERVVGSISYYPAMCASTIVAIVVNKFLKEEIK